MSENKPKIEVRHTSILIHDYNIHDSEKLEKSLSIYDQVRHKYIMKGAQWDKENKILYIPRGVDINFLEKIFNTPAEMNYTPDPYEPMSIRAKVPPRDDMQRRAIAFLIGAEKYAYTKKYSQLLLNLPTGSGKTYVMTTALQFIGERAFIIVPNEKIKKQIITSFISMTDIDKKLIIDVRGKSEINKIFRQTLPRYKIYVACHGTLISYAGRNGWDEVDRLFKHTRVGVKIYDEAHLFFDNILKIDFHTNTKKTIYMTATFKRSDYSENILFNNCFRNVVKHGLDEEDVVRKHIMYLGLQYNSKPSLDKQGFMMTNRGFNKIRYSDYQVEQNEFYDALAYAINYFKKYEGKILILSSTIDSVEKIKKFVDDSYDDMSVSSYHSKVVGDDRDKAFSADIICTTPKSAGVGVDIPGLRVVIMCEAYSSEIEADQVSGRLREFNKSDDTYYVELIDIGFPTVTKMWKRRLTIFKKKCKKLLSIDLSKK